MKIAMVSEQASPLAAIGGADAGGQNVYVGALAGVLAKAGHKVTVYTRRDAPDQPDEVSVSSRFTVRHVSAGPPRDVPGDELLPLLPGEVAGDEAADLLAQIVEV